MARSRLRIPSSQLEGLAALVKLSPSEREALVRSLAASSASLNLDEYGRNLASSTSLDAETARGILELLVSLHATKEDFGMETAEFVQQIRPAIESLRREDLIPVDWPEFERFITLSGESGLALTAKALFISTEYQNLYCSARILTDQRPVFGANVEESPSAMITIHNLKLTYHEGSVSTRDFFLALDRSDIDELIILLERAKKKEESLNRLSREKGLRVLEVER
jgi:hypothetical protein